VNRIRQPENQKKLENQVFSRSQKKKMHRASTRVGVASGRSIGLREKGGKQGEKGAN